MRIVITTPTGNIGRELTKRLLDQKRHELILLARTPDKLTKEQARGGEDGPRDYSLDECARIIGRAIGKEVRHVQVSPAKAKEAMIGMGATAGVADTMLEMYAAFQAGTLKDEAKRSPETTTPTTFETFVKDVLAPALKG